MMQYPCGFAWQPLDTIIFLGSDVIRAGDSPYYEGLRAYSHCPATTKIIVPCGKLDVFLASFAFDPIRWQDPVTWTSANFIEAECLNTLTVLSSDVNLGNAWSMNGGQIITSTPSNTSANYSGTATLVAIAKTGEVFTGWADGNTDNPRTVTVSSDTTFTANFATCENVGIDEIKSAFAPFNVFPNPTNSILHVQLEEFVSNGTLTLFDMNGKVVLSQTVSGVSAQINMSALSTGNYVLRLVENGKASVGVQVFKN